MKEDKEKGEREREKERRGRDRETKEREREREIGEMVHCVAGRQKTVARRNNNGSSKIKWLLKCTKHTQ